MTDELSNEKAREIFEKVCRREMNMSPREFIAAWDRGDIGWDNPVRASHVAMLRPFWENSFD